MATVELKLSRPNRVYRPSETIEGKVVIKSPSSISHYGVRLSLNASVNLQVRGGSAGVIESLYGAVKPITIMSDSTVGCIRWGTGCLDGVELHAYTGSRSSEIKPSGKFASGTTEIPFSMPLKHPGEDTSEKFHETYHGTNISIQYLATVDIARGYLYKSLSCTLEFIVESDKADLLEKPVSPEMVMFHITQDTQRHVLLSELKSGGFRINGRLTSLCSLMDPIRGELTVEMSAVPIRSIDIHLLSMESILVGEKIVTETSLVQTTQIADGDLCRNMTMPIHVILPRLLTCPTILAGPFSIEFKVSIVISFQSDLSTLHAKSDATAPRLWSAMETLPLELVRTK